MTAYYISPLLAEVALPTIKLNNEITTIGSKSELLEGKRMDRLMHNHGNLTPSSRMPPRVKMEGEDNADLDKGKRMERLLHEYQKQPASARPAPRVKSGIHVLINKK